MSVPLVGYASDQTTPANKPKAQVTPALSGEAKRVADAVSVLRDAIRTGDAASAERVLSPSVSIFEQGHVEASRAEYMAHHFKEDVAYATVVTSNVVSTKVDVDGGVAIVTATTESTGTYKDKAVSSVTVETYVLRLRGSAWQIEHIHWSSRKR
jgi:ketosteroid isomerase-like protein